MSGWAVVPIPFGDPMPAPGTLVVGPEHPSRTDAARRGDELEALAAGRWPVEYVVVRLDGDHRVVSAHPPNPRRTFAEPARRWARQSLKALPEELERPEAVGALMAESGLSATELRRLQRAAVGPDPERSAAAKASAAQRRKVAAALEREGSAALPEALSAGARRAAFERVRGGESVTRAVREAVREARELEAVALDGAVSDSAAAARALLREADRAPASRAALLEGAAALAALGPAADPCAGPEGRPGTIPGPDGAPLPIVWGAKAELVIPAEGGLEHLPCVYALLDVGRLQISHNPFTFAPNRVYPAGLQERDYQRDRSEQAKVMQAASRFLPELVINTAADPSSGPPIIDQGPPWVLGGNSRAMTISRVLRERDNTYTPSLRAELGGCTSFGLGPDQVTTASVLVRVLQGTYDPVAISRQLNLGFTAAAGPAARAVSTGAVLPAGLFDLLAADLLEEGATLSRAMSRNGPAIVRMLRAAGVITPQTAPVWQVSRAGRLLPELSSDGRQLLRGALLGRLVGDKEALSLTSARLEDVYERAAPALLALELGALG